MDIDPRFGDAEEIGPIEDLQDLRLDEEDPTRVVKVGINLETTTKEALITFLRKNQDVFAWSHKDMVGIDPSISCHQLNIDSHFFPIQQKRRLLDKERSRALKEEVKKLRENGFIQEAYYPSWVVNPVLVPKTNRKWQTCVDFTDLNKACPKDCFPLPRIDQLVDATAGHEVLSFMDAYSGYNQIIMHPPYEEHTSFQTDTGLYCYKVTSFGLKNVGAT